MANLTQTLLTSKRTEKDFTFPFPLKHKVVRNLKIVTESNGILEVSGKGYMNPAFSVLDIYDRYSVDIDFIRWNGVDVKPVLEVTGGLEEIEEAAVQYFASKMEGALINQIVRA